MIKVGNRIRLFRSSKPAASTIILLFLFIFLVSVSLATPVHRWGDASTYYMQTQSIANDFDIQYEQKDLQKAFENKFDDLPAGLVLIKDEAGTYFYGKEFSYALLAAPFLKIFGNNGILVFNALMFFLMIYMGYLFLKRQNSDMIAIIFSICYFFASAAFVYIFWIHTEIYNMFLIMLGFFLWFKSMPFESGKSINSLKENKSELKTQSPNNWLFIAAVVFGLAAFARIPNAILFLPLLGWELYNKRFKNLILCVSFFVIPLIILFGYFYLITGTLMPYSGDRLGYGHKFPFMDGYDLNNEIGQSAYTASSKIFSEIATLNMIVLSYDMFYYLFGRFTGLTWYYMPAIIALYLMFRRKIKNFNPRMKRIFKSENFNIKHVLILSAIVLNALFYFVHSPNNYFGGAHAIGNRYFYIFPAFLFLVDEIKFDKKLVAFFIIAILFIAPININPIGNSGTPCMHTVKLPYSALPVEYTQLNILPFWGCSHKIGDISYYHLDDNVKWRSNGFLVEKDSDMLINSKSKILNYGILLSSSSDNNLICLSVGNVTKSLTLNRQEVKLLTFSNPSSVYNEKYFVYKIHVSSDDRLWFRPIELGEKNTLYYIDNWFGLEHWHNIPTRWTSNNATIFVYSPGDRDSNLSFNVVSFYKPRNLQMYLNDDLIHEQKIPTSFVELETALKLKEGNNVLRFYTPDGCQRPVDIPKLKNKDGRCLSLAFQNIALTPIKEITT